MSCCCEQEFDSLLGVGAVTDAGEFVERVHTEILTLDADVQRAVENEQQPLRADFNFNAWNSFVNDDIDLDEDFVHPPHGWRKYRGSLRNIDFALNQGKVMQITGLFEQEYARFRESFKFSGGKPTAPDPIHPGVFRTPQEEQKKIDRTNQLMTWGIVIAGVVAAGYLLSSAAPLLPSPRRT